MYLFSYDSTCYSVLNYLALIFSSLLRLINSVPFLPSITAFWEAWSHRRVMGKPFKELVVNVNKTSPWVSKRFRQVCFPAYGLYGEIYLLTLSI